MDEKRRWVAVRLSRSERHFLGLLYPERVDADVVFAPRLLKIYARVTM
jgi:hypothetical protein